ncbi:MAG: hypothetical protein FP832_01770, partial [Nitrospirae bacterium]|nr:hypothetical protein [Nitrospirota bacterium]
EGAHRGFLTGGELLLDMLEDRNKTSHIYDESTANEIFKRIKQKYINLMEENLKLFAAYLASEK